MVGKPQLYFVVAVAAVAVVDGADDRGGRASQSVVPNGEL